MAHNAKTGGELGANGEFYAGGQFVNTIAANDKRAAREAAKYMARKQEIAPYSWALPATPASRAIYGRLNGVYAYGRTTGLFGDAPAQWRAYVGADHAAAMDALRDAYNNGARWAE